MDINVLSGEIVDAAMKVHTALGPGLLESAYRGCLLFELHRRDIQAVSELAMPVNYDGVKIDLGYRIDLFVENQIIVECKAVAEIHPLHKAQLLSYLRLSGCKLGLLINFHEVHLKNGIQRMVHNL